MLEVPLGQFVTPSLVPIAAHPRRSGPPEESDVSVPELGEMGGRHPRPGDVVGVHGVVLDRVVGAPEGDEGEPGLDERRDPRISGRRLGDDEGVGDAGVVEL